MLASAEIKKDEKGILELSEKLSIPVEFVELDKLKLFESDDVSKSEFVKNTVGVDNVCERAAAASGGEIIVKKTAMNGVTAAVAEMKWGIEFG